MKRLLQLYKDSFAGLSREVWLLAVMMFINRSGTMVIAFLTVYLTQKLGFGYTDAGLVMSCFGLGSVAGSFLGGWLNDRIGYFQVMFWSLLLAGIGFILIMNFESMLEFSIGIFLITTIGDSFRPASYAAVGIYSKPENQTRSLSLVRIAINLGLGLGPAAAGFIIATWGYPYIFIVDGITCISAAFFFAFVFRSKVKNKTEQQIPTAEERAKERSPYSDAFYMGFVFCILLSMIAFMQLFTNLPIYYQEHFGLTEAQFGWLMALNGLIIAITEMPIIFVLEKRYDIFSLIIAGTGLFALSYIVFPIFSTWVGITVIAMIAITVGEIISFPFTNKIVLERATPARRGEYMGVYSMSFALGLIIAPSFGGWIVEHWGFDTLWYVTTIFSGLAMIGFAFLQGIYNREQAQAKKEHDLVEHLVEH